MIVIPEVFWKRLMTDSTLAFRKSNLIFVALLSLKASHGLAESAVLAPPLSNWPNALEGKSAPAIAPSRTSAIAREVNDLVRAISVSPSSAPSIGTIVVGVVLHHIRIKRCRLATIECLWVVQICWVSGYRPP